MFIRIFAICIYLFICLICQDSVARRTSVKLKAAMSAVASASVKVSTPPKTPKTKISPIKKPATKYSSDEEDSDEDEVEDTRLLEGKIRTKKGCEVNNYFIYYLKFLKTP